MEKRKIMPQRSTLIKILTFFVILIVMCGALTLIARVIISNLGAVGGVLSGKNDTGCLEVRDQPHIEFRASLVLPPSAKNLSAASIAPQDCTIYVSFEMDPADLDAFLASTYVLTLNDAMGSTLTDFKNEGVDLEAWTFESDKKYLYGEGQDKTGRINQGIVIDHVDAETDMVYVITNLKP